MEKLRGHPVEKGARPGPGDRRRAEGRSAPYIAALEYEEGVLTVQAAPLVVRFVRPLTISREQIDTVAAAFERVLTAEH